MLLVDARQTRDIQNGRCVQFKVHFYGPVAGRIEHDLSYLLSKGQLDSPTIQVHGAHVDPKRSRTIPYHVCDESDNGITPTIYSCNVFKLTKFYLNSSCAAIFAK